MSYLPFESFACDYTDVARVCRQWRNAVAGCRAHVRVTVDNVRYTHRLGRIPLVARICADHFDETLVNGLRGVKHLLSLEWRALDARAFDALPDIIRANPRLIAINGSPSYFTAPLRSPTRVVRAGQECVWRTARVCETLLVARSEDASINGVPAHVCDCGQRRIFTVCCTVPYCARFRPSKLTSTSVSSAQSVNADAGMLAAIQNMDVRVASRRMADDLMDITTRYMDRLQEWSVIAEQKENAMQLQTRLLMAAKCEIRDLKADLVELRGQIAERDMIIAAAAAKSTKLPRKEKARKQS